MLISILFFRLFQPEIRPNNSPEARRPIRMLKVADRVLRALGPLVAGLALSVAPAVAQENPEGAGVDKAATADSAAAEQVSEGQGFGRETFVYPEGPGRRDPFAPLTAGEEIGPRFADLELSGLIFAPDIGSVAVLTDRATLRRYRVREGDWLGEARVDRIRADEVSFTVAGFGLSRTEVLRVERDDQE